MSDMIGDAAEAILDLSILANGPSEFLFNEIDDLMVDVGRGWAKRNSPKIQKALRSRSRCAHPIAESYEGSRYANQEEASKCLPWGRGKQAIGIRVTDQPGDPLYSMWTGFNREKLIVGSIQEQGSRIVRGMEGEVISLSEYPIRNSTRLAISPIPQIVKTLPQKAEKD